MLHSLLMQTVVFFANASDGQYSKERSGASVKTERVTRPQGVRGSCALHARITLTALRAFRKCRKTAVLQSFVEGVGLMDVSSY